MNDLSKGLLVAGVLVVFVFLALLDTPLIPSAGLLIIVIIGIVFAIIWFGGSPFDSHLTKQLPDLHLADRQIPRHVKQYVWQRDGGRCAQCGSNKRVEYAYIIPVSKGGSNTEGNVQLLCEQCNDSKYAKIM